MEHAKKERTFVIVKPDGVQRSLIGEIVKRFERVGLKVSGLKMVMADEAKLWKHYNKDDEWFESKGKGIISDLEKAGIPVEKSAMDYGKNIVDVLVKFMTAGPVVMMVLEGNQAALVVKKLVGGTEPSTSDIGTIRGDLTLDSYSICTVDDRAVRNLVHCSDSAEEAEREVALWFDKDELINYTIVNEKILYDVNLDGIME